MKTIISMTLLLLLGACARDVETRAWNISGVSSRDIVVAVQAAGVIEPVSTVELKSKASGEILRIVAETGDTVTSGQLLVQIDERTPRNSLAQARAELEAARARRDIAKSQRDRGETLFRSGTLNQVDYEQSILEFANATAEVVRAEVALENARIALDDTEVRAPVPGTIIERNVEVGQVISSPTMDVGGGTLLLKMADLRSVQVRALVDETDIGKIRPQQAAVVTVAAYPNQPFQGKIIKVEPKADETEGALQSVTLFGVIVTIDNESGLLRPGMNAEVDIDIASRYGVPAVPTIALRTPRDIPAAALYVGMEEDVLRAQLRDSGMPVAAMPVSGASPDREAAEETEEVEEAVAGQGYQFGGDYWLFVMRDGKPRVQRIRTGLTDLDYSEVVSGVTAEDEILLLPSSDLILSQDRFRQMFGRTMGLPGMNRDDSSRGR